MKASTKQNPRESCNMPICPALKKFALRHVDADFLANLQRHKSRKVNRQILWLLSWCSTVRHGFHDPVNLERNAVSAVRFKRGYVTAEVKLIESGRFDGEDSGFELKTAVLYYRIKV